MNRIKELRKAKGITQQKMANDLGLSRSAISMYEIEASEPDFDTIRRIADYFDVSLDYLMGRDTNLSEPLSIPPALEGIPLAFHEGLKDLKQEDLEAVAKFIDFLKNKDGEKKDK